MSLYNKLKKYSLQDAINFEENDRQFLALKKLFENKKLSDNNYLFLIIANALICYQLSGKGEDYWEEFGTSSLIPLLIGKENIDFGNIYTFFEKFLKKSKNNKRFIKTKLKRIKKLENFYDFFLEKYEFYYKNMDKLAGDLSDNMKQKKDAKTIVFAVKMFSYGARLVFGYLKIFPENLMIPIDSRLEKLYKKESSYLTSPKREGEKINNKKIKEFYLDLSKKLNIPLLHLDAILWLNYEKLIK